MNPEPELLLCCARTRLDRDRARRLKVLVQKEINWTHLLQMALSHGLTPLLHWHLSATCPEAIPQAVLDHLHQHFDRNAERNRSLATELAHVLKLFRRHQLQSLPLGGLILGETVYQNPDLRELSTLEILVPRRDIVRASALLLSHGYRPAFHPACALNASHMRLHPDHIFLHEDRQVCLTLRWGIGSTCFPVNLELASLWCWPEPVSLEGQEFPFIAPEDLLLILCADGALHQWQRLGWLSDVAELISLYPRMDLGRVIARSRTLGAERILLLGLFLANDILVAILPLHIIRAACNDPAVRALSETARARLFQASPESSTFFHLKARERLLDKARYCFRLLATPTAGDYAFFPLPPRLFFFYYLLRPIRLLGYALGLIKRPPSLDLAPFIPTPAEIVERALELAGVGPTDVIYDLGCGDGRIVITAAKRYGARGFGVDLDPQRIQESRLNARAADVDGLVAFTQQDAQTVNVTPATVVFLYLNSSSTLMLCSTLNGKLRPGTRIVLHDFDLLPSSDIDGWKLLSIETVRDTHGRPHGIQVRQVPTAPLSSSLITDIVAVLLTLVGVLRGLHRRGSAW